MNAQYSGHGRGRFGKGGWRSVALASCVTLSLAATMALHAPAAFAQDDNGNASGRADDNGGGQQPYSDGDTSMNGPTSQPPANDPGADPAAVAADAANSGPVRMARFTVVSGDVTWRGGTDGEWTSGVNNMPLRQGSQVWVSSGGRAEIQFDDGSRLRLDSNTLVTLQTLYSDTKGEYTEVTLNDGQIDLRATNEYSIYQVNTPLCSVKAGGPAKVRVGAGQGVQVSVRQGNATVQGTADHARLHSGDYIDLADETAQYNIVDAPQEDAWDRYNDDRDRSIDALASAPTAQHLPPNIAQAAGDLDEYGTWRDDPQYGWIWVPTATVSDAEWRPYYAGHWTWVEPFGWTWVSTESWGWAPYHYGTWVHAGYGWAWSPGPREQYWSPGVVAFYQDRGQVAWCPLAPHEVHYPATIAIGFRSARWSAFFSIGGAAVYYPGAHNVCEPRPWSGNYVNHVTYVRNVTNVTNITVINNGGRNGYGGGRNGYGGYPGGEARPGHAGGYGGGPIATNVRFVASNARYGGAVCVSADGFQNGQGGHYVGGRGNAAFVRTAQVIGAPQGGRPVGGPAVRPTLASFSPTRTFRPTSNVPRPVLDRTVYRAAPPATVARTAATPAMNGQRFYDTPRGGNGNAGTIVGGGRGGNSGRFGGGNQNPDRGGSGTVTRPSDNRGDNGTVTRPGDSRGGNGSVTRPGDNRGGLQDYLRDRNNGGNSGNSNTGSNRDRNNGNMPGAGGGSVGTNGGAATRPTHDNGSSSSGRFGGRFGTTTNPGSASNPGTTGGAGNAGNAGTVIGNGRGGSGSGRFGGGDNSRTSPSNGTTMGTPASNPVVTPGGNRNGTDGSRYGNSGGNNSGRVFRGGQSSGDGGSNTSDDRRYNQTYGHAPVERSSDNRNSSGGSTSGGSGHGDYRPLHNGGGRDATVRDSGNRDSGRSSSSKDSGSKDSKDKDSSSKGSDRVGHDH